MKWPISKNEPSPAFLESLAGAEWQAVHLRFWSDREQAARLVDLAGTQGWAALIREEEGIPWIDLTDNWEDSVSHKLREDINYNLKRLTEKYGSVELVSASEDDWDEFIGAYRKLWRRFGTEPLLTRSQRTADFVRGLDKDLTAFHKLQAGGKTIAWHFGYRFAKEFTYEFPTYDTTYGKYSPGKVLLWFLIQWAKEHRDETFSFGRGEEPYKLRWTKTVKPLISVNLYRSRFWAKCDPLRARGALAVVYKKAMGRRR
jgi:CelD/BcsL family acetyltransferase involved in cellulose biosynthesis